MSQDDVSSNPNAIENLTPEELADREATFGPLYRFSEYKPGATIRFKLRGKPVSGEIVWVTGPSDLPASGRHVPVTYVVGVEGELSFALVYPGEIIQD